MTETHPNKQKKKQLWRWWMIFPAIYVALLTASFIQRAASPTADVTLLPHQEVRMVGEIRDGQPTGKQIRMAYLDFPVEDGANGEFPLLLVHGSPGSGDDLDKLAAKLQGPRRLIAPDLPGTRSQQAPRVVARVDEFQDAAEGS